MKTAINRILILLFVFCLVLSGCTTNAPVETTAATLEPVVTTEDSQFISNLSVGFGRMDISPTEPPVIMSKKNRARC